MAVGLRADGSVALAAGAVTTPVFPRSSNKPMQATAMLRCGLDLDGELLALAAASHSGEDFHVAGARQILARAGLTEDDLQCPPDLSGDEETHREMVRTGAAPDRLHFNCSGKHAAMLATCVAAGWPTATYRDPQHPLQQAIAATVAELAGEPVAAVGVDGCGAPLMAISVTGLARAFRTLVLAEPGTPERRVADAFRAYPAWTSGTHRAENKLMTAVPGLMVKAGAEGVEAFALADGRAGALKLEDGGQRARAPLTVAILRELGVADVPGVNLAALDELATVPVTGGGQPVGEVRARLPVTDLAADGITDPVAGVPQAARPAPRPLATASALLAFASRAWDTASMKPVNVNTIGEYIREQREQARISLRQLAQNAGISNPYLSQVERGLRRPSADILQQIAKGLRISAEALYIQAGFLEDKQPSSMVREAVLTDPDLTERQKQMVIEIYESFRKETRLAEGKDGEVGDLPPDEAALTWPEDVGEDALDAGASRPAIEPQQGGESSKLAP
jgi:L-asparaginase II/transcriptional regulator with XRE-family HTH domain